ncbi:MAG: VWA domain-containing protein [Bacteroidota bacterium]|nr:VWA domain-containing protein [Bacteroidota bacterium]
MGIVVLVYFLYVGRITWIAISLQTSFRSVFIKLITRTIYFSLVIIALMAPSFGDIKKEIKAIGKDMYILVDLSNSMNAKDIQPSRLEKMKFELKRITDAFSSDRIGLIIFSSDAFVQCPLTYDIGALNLFIETLNTSLVPSAGTDFAPALEIAMKRFAKMETNNSSNPKSKIVILVSDGEDFGEETEGLADDLERQGIKLFTVGIGTSEGAKIPFENGFKRDNNGKIVVSKLNSDALKKLSDITGGNYYEVSDKQNDVARLINDINKIEGELREVKTVDTSANKYFYFLFAAFIFMVLDILITVKTIRI